MSSSIKMKYDPNFNLGMFDWKARGYFSVSESIKDVAFPSDPFSDPWPSIVMAMRHAQRGNFKLITRLVSIGTEELDPLVFRAMSQLVGDAAPSVVFEGILDKIALNEFYENTYDWCDAVATRGRLGDIPALLNAYEANINDVDDDAVIILIRIKQMLDSGLMAHYETFDSFKSYRNHVMECYHRLLDIHGTEEVLLWRGKPTSVKAMAEMLRSFGSHPSLPGTVRRRFEASTGIDCTLMFDKQERFRSLEAAAIAEDFLSGDELERYEDGVRYFFGHRVPD